MNDPEPFNDLSWNDDPLHSPNRTEYIEKLRARVKYLESICNEVSKEYPIQKYLEEGLGTKGEHSHFETIDNTAAKLTALEKERDQLKGGVETFHAVLRESREIFDLLWDELEMGWLTDGDSDSSYCECGECGAKQINSKEGIIHSKECVQGKVHQVLSRIISTLNPTPHDAK